MPLGKPHTRGHIMAEINVTPLTDVFLDVDFQPRRARGLRGRIEVVVLRIELRGIGPRGARNPREARDARRIRARVIEEHEVAHPHLPRRLVEVHAAAAREERRRREEPAALLEHGDHGRTQTLNHEYVPPA